MYMVLGDPSITTVSTSRLALLYKYGGFYLDMDIIILKSLREVKNAYSIEHAKPRFVSLSIFRYASQNLVGCRKQFQLCYIMF